MFKKLTTKDRVESLLKEQARLKASLLQKEADLEYLAMMMNVDLEESTEEIADE